jgi:ribosomal protein L11 methyltransferase
VPLAEAEAARAVMIGLFPEGFEEVVDGEEIELAAYTDAEGERRLRHALGPGAAEPVAPDWEDAWRRFHRPQRVGPLWVGPPWERPHEGALAVVIDPGRAFGTGAHPTTRLCLELLLEREPGSLLDLGCGSGVLAIAAALLGFAPVIALDNDEAAVEATRTNAAANGVAIQVRRADVAATDLPEAGLAVANIALPVVEQLSGRIQAPLLVASGYLEHERLDLPGWRGIVRRKMDGWAADLLERLYD